MKSVSIIAIILLTMIVCFVYKAHADDSIYAGIGGRTQAYDVGYAHDFGASPFGVDVQYIDEGVQPFSADINRVLNIDARYTHSLPFGLTGFVKAGLSDSSMGYSAAGNGYKNRTNFSGQNFGFGVSYPLTKNISATLEDVEMRYQQVSVPAYETFNYGSIGVAYRF